MLLCHHTFQEFMNFICNSRALFSHLLVVHQPQQSYRNATSHGPEIHRIYLALNNLAIKLSALLKCYLYTSVNFNIRTFYLQLLPSIPETPLTTILFPIQLQKILHIHTQFQHFLYQIQTKDWNLVWRAQYVQ